MTEIRVPQTGSTFYGDRLVSIKEIVSETRDKKRPRLYKIGESEKTSYRGICIGFGMG